ncbi:hypothetical protein TRVA0_072S00298 [Trichomonascus vanleenenianus]|uniref:uncharacterized protein n=1 Tax=Trichomonascus vanleenenianus TaxID=2268995 RepID=UPI003EC9CFC7
MVEFWRFVLLILAAAQVALGNTEQVRFKWDRRAASERSEDLATLDASAPDARIEITLTPESYLDRISKRVKVINGVEGQMYEVRVCWPASHPADFDVAYEEGGYVKIGFSSDIYSHIPEVMYGPREVPVDIILNKVIADALPEDIVGPIGLVGVALVAGHFISKFIISKF